MRLETIDKALVRMGLTKEAVRDKLICLKELHQEAVKLIGHSVSSTFDGYDFGYMQRNSFSWVMYRWRCYPVKQGSKRYMSCLISAERLQEIEQSIKQIDPTYDPEIECIRITRKWLHSGQIDQSQQINQSEDSHWSISI